MVTSAARSSLTVPAQFESTLALSPDKGAVFCGRDSLTFAELHEQALATARALIELGVQPGDRIGVCMRKTPDQVVTILATLYANAVFVPVHYVLQPEQIGHIASDCGMKLLVTEAGRIEELNHAVATKLAVGRDQETESALSLAKLRRECRTSESIFSAAPDDSAAIIYSSGSTGRPKGIVISHRNLADGARIVSSYLGTDSNDRIAGVLGLTFDHGLNQLWQTLLKGSSLYLHDLIFPRDLFRLLARERITALPLMPVIISRMFDQQLAGPEANLDFSALRYISSTGGTVTPGMLADLQRTFPRSKVFLMYGLTEAFRSSYLPPEQVSVRPTSIGRAIPDVELYVLDENGHDCPPDVPGQLVHRGGCVTKGYWNAPKATAERFRQIDRFPGETVVFSGDLVRRDREGYLYFLARMDSMIKTYGFRVSPTEIEEHARKIPGLLDAVAFGVDNPAVGQDIAVTYTSKDGNPLPTDELAEHFRVTMPHHMVPRWFLHCQTFPMTPSQGKIDRVLVHKSSREKLAALSSTMNNL